MMFISAVSLLVLDAAGTRWEQTSAADFDDGESFFVETSGGTLKLSRGLTGTWSAVGESSSDYFGRSVASAGDVNGDGYADVIVGAYGNDGAGSLAGEAYVYGGSGYVERGVFESRTFNLADGEYDGVDWISLSWTPSKPQPAGTSVKAQIGTSSDGRTWTWHGPTGSTSSYFTSPAGQAIYTGDRDQFLKVRFYLTSDFSEPGDAKGDGAGVRTPSVESFTLEYAQFHKPVVQLTWPNGGENLMHGESYAVTWDVTGDLSGSTAIALAYSLDGGSTYTSITSATANDGHYLWTLPSNENVERALIRITATALDGSTVQDTSDGTFSIDPPEFWQTGDGETIDTEPPAITLFAPGEATSGEPLTVRAEVSDETAVTQVALRYTAGDGEPVTVAMSPAGNGVWEVTLLPAEGALELAVIASDGSNVVETPSQSLSVGAAGGAGTAAGGSMTALAVLGAAALGLLAGLSRRRE
ncbi:MAG: integrin alpha [Candidatus Poseidoniia archaeon]|nr:integrin alpha [Candidatus Poseidoniia archaeon]